MSSRPCSTCSKPVYQKEKIAVSDVWVCAGCLKCSLCDSTLALTSTYVGLDTSGAKRLFCRSDVPRTIHHAVVDSIALRHALSAPKPDQFRAAGRLSGGKLGSLRFKGLTLRSKVLVGGLHAPKRSSGDGSRNKIVIGTVRGATLDSWDVASALQAQAQTSSPHKSFPAVEAQMNNDLIEGSFMTPSIVVPPPIGSSRSAASDDAGQQDDDGIAREEKGQKEKPLIEAGLVKNLLRAFQLEEVREVKLPAGHVRSPTPFAFRGKPTEVSSPLGANDGGVLLSDETRFLSVKPSAAALACGETSDLVDFRTLGTRRDKGTSVRRKPALKSLFDPPTAAEVDDAPPSKHVKISSGPPSLISLFAGSDVLPTRPASPGNVSDEGEDADDEAEDMDDEAFARAMEGLEVVLVYEEEPEVGKAAETVVGAAY